MTTEKDNIVDGDAPLDLHPVNLIRDEPDPTAAPLALDNLVDDSTGTSGATSSTNGGGGGGGGAIKDPSHDLPPMPSKAALQAEVQGFLTRKKGENSQSNRKEFVATTDHASARTSAATLERATQIRTTRAQYEDDETPLAKVQATAKRAKRARLTNPVGVEERLGNLEHFLAIRAPTVAPVASDVYTRLKQCEDRLLELENRFGVTRHQIASLSAPPPAPWHQDIGGVSGMAAKSTAMAAEAADAIPVIRAATSVDPSEAQAHRGDLDQRIEKLQESLRSRHAGYGDLDQRIEQPQESLRSRHTSR